MIFNMAKFRFTLILAGLLAIAGCASAPPKAQPEVETVERVRADDALTVFQELALQDEYYIVYFRGEPAGTMERVRRVRGGQIEVISTLITTNEELSGQVITERFDAVAPHDATLLSIADVDGPPSVRIVREPDGYVGIANNNGIGTSEPIFDFRYRLADALAPEIWVRNGAEVGDCLSYPDYSFDTFRRQFMRECIAGMARPTIDGKPVDAVRTQLNSSILIVRARDTGMELRTRQSRELELRLEPRAIATQLQH